MKYYDMIQSLLNETVIKKNHSGVNAGIKGKIDQYQLAVYVESVCPNDWVWIGNTMSSSGADVLFGKVSSKKVVELFEIEVKGNSGSNSNDISHYKPSYSGSGKSYINSPTPALKVLFKHLTKSTSKGDQHIIDWKKAAPPLESGLTSQKKWAQMALSDSFVKKVNSGAITNCTLISGARDAGVQMVKYGGGASDISKLKMKCIGFAAVIGRRIFGMSYHGYDIGLSQPDYVVINKFTRSTGGKGQQSSMAPSNKSGTKQKLASSNTMTEKNYIQFRGAYLARIGRASAFQDTWSTTAKQVSPGWTKTYKAKIVKALKAYGITKTNPTADDTVLLLRKMSSSVIKGNPDTLYSGFTKIISKKSKAMIGANASTQNVTTVYMTAILDGLMGVPYMGKKKSEPDYRKCFERALDWVIANGISNSTVLQYGSKFVSSGGTGGGDPDTTTDSGDGTSKPSRRSTSRRTTGKKPTSPTTKSFTEVRKFVAEFVNKELGLSGKSASGLKITMGKKTEGVSEFVRTRYKTNMSLLNQICAKEVSVTVSKGSNSVTITPTVKKKPKKPLKKSDGAPDRSGMYAVLKAYGLDKIRSELGVSGSLWTISTAKMKEYYAHAQSGGKPSKKSPTSNKNKKSPTSNKKVNNSNTGLKKATPYETATKAKEVWDGGTGNTASNQAKWRGKGLSRKGGTNSNRWDLKDLYTSARKNDKAKPRKGYKFESKYSLKGQLITESSPELTDGISSALQLMQLYGSDAYGIDDAIEDLRDDGLGAELAQPEPEDSMDVDFDAMSTEAGFSGRSRPDSFDAM